MKLELFTKKFFGRGYHTHHPNKIDKKKCLVFRKKGWTLQEIGGEFGVSRQAVFSILKTIAGEKKGRERV